ncbi:hypothetical protein [Streptococcus danieliae]|uniref:hypothetical protein n=1 Tax=Streptococcus danieliae TaxID=747656 RepID=UPI0017C041EC|nr:hypothetical protein [Streptococcus danieliae]NYS33697.1 hypothetical protein [Streptococcus danieliae]
MTENKFAELKQKFESSSNQSVSRKKRGRKRQGAPVSPETYEKKQRYPFSLHYDVRYEKLEDLVNFHRAKSASEYLENLIIREWDKMQRKLKSKED